MKNIAPVHSLKISDQAKCLLETEHALLVGCWGGLVEVNWFSPNSKSNFSDFAQFNVRSDVRKMISMDNGLCLIVQNEGYFGVVFLDRDELKQPLTFKISGASHIFDVCQMKQHKATFAFACYNGLHIVSLESIIDDVTAYFGLKENLEKASISDHAI